MKQSKNNTEKNSVSAVSSPEKKNESLRVGTVIVLLVIFVLLAAANLIMMIEQNRSEDDDALRANAETQVDETESDTVSSSEYESERVTTTDEVRITDESETTSYTDSEDTTTTSPEENVTTGELTQPTAVVTTVPPSKTTETTPKVVVTTPAPITETDAPKVTTAEPYVYPEYCAQVRDFINAERKAAGLNPLGLDVTATKAAVIRAEEITEVFSHVRPDGTSCFTVLDLFPKFFSWSSAENIAAGLPSPESVVKCWMSSEGHKKNILTANYTHMGVALTKTDSGYKYYWSLILVQPEYGAL